MQNNFKKLRKEKGITQCELSNMLNVTQTTISKWELNKALPEANMLIQLADYYSVSTDYLLGRSNYYPVKVDNQITPLEQTLISDFRKLPAQSQEYILGIVHNLAISA